MQGRTGRGERSLRGRARWAAGLGTGGVALWALVVLSTAASASAPPTANVVHVVKVVAPYHGATGVPSTTLSTTGCAAASSVLAPTFVAKTGVASFASSSGASTCRTSKGNYASTDQSIEMSVPLPSLSGTQHIRAHWTFSLSGGQTLNAGRCSLSGPVTSTSYGGCYAYTGASFGAYEYVYDATNGTYFASTTSYHSWSNGTTYELSCYAGNCTTYTSGGPGSFTVSGPVTLSVLAPGLVASHHYVLVTTLEGSTYVDIAEFGTGHLHHAGGTAWVNFGLFGNGGTLESITAW
jgi:hypothetical protein